MKTAPVAAPAPPVEQVRDCEAHIAALTVYVERAEERAAQLLADIRAARVRLAGR